jgi:hypothetical protein
MMHLQPTRLSAHLAALAGALDGTLSANAPCRRIDVMQILRREARQFYPHEEAQRFALPALGLVTAKPSNWENDKA